MLHTISRGFYGASAGAEQLMALKNKNKESRYRWWSFKDCDQYVAFFSEKNYAIWYANLFALTAKRDVVPEVVPIYRLDITEREETPDGTLLAPPTEEYRLDSKTNTPSSPWRTM